MTVAIAFNSTIETSEVVALYKANQWSSADKPKPLMAALRNSHTLVTARADERLVGLANAISDGHLVVYYPHMLVHPDFHRKGIGRQLMQAMQTIYADYHQQMLTADPDAIRFYKSVGFVVAGRTQSMWNYRGNEHQ